MPLYDAGARFYAPSLGVFTQADSVAGSAQDPASLNRYLYTAANPATLIDPDGHAYCGPDGILCGAHPTSSHPAARAKHHAPARHHAPPRRRLSGELDAIGHDRGRTILRHSQASHSRTISRLVRARETRTEIDGLGHDRGRTIARRTQNLTRAQVSRLAGVGKVDTDGFIHERGRTIARRTQTSRLAQAAVAAAETAATDARESRTLAATAARGGPNASDNTALHMALGAVGFIPVIGTAANLADAAVYASEGDYLGATLSAAAAVPLLGEGADAVKEARLAGKALDEGVKLAEEARSVESLAGEAHSRPAGVPSLGAGPSHSGHQGLRALGKPLDEDGSEDGD